MPHFFLQTNGWRHTTHWIILTFFLLTSSLFLMVNNNVDTLSGVYTYALLNLSAFIVTFLQRRLSVSHVSLCTRQHAPQVQAFTAAT